MKYVDPLLNNKNRRDSLLIIPICIPIYFWPSWGWESIFLMSFIWIDGMWLPYRKMILLSTCFYIILWSKSLIIHSTISIELCYISTNEQNSSLEMNTEHQQIHKHTNNNRATNSNNHTSMDLRSVRDNETLLCSLECSLFMVEMKGIVIKDCSLWLWKQPIFIIYNIIITRMERRRTPVVT